MPALGEIVRVDELSHSNEELASLWERLGTSNGPQNDTVGDRAAGVQSGHDHAGADVITE